MKTILTAGLTEQNIPFTEKAVDTLCAYCARLLDVNRTTNLTAIRDQVGAARLHFLDSAALLDLAEFDGKTVIDVGSGAGFPGVPIAVLAPTAQVTVIDSVGKKMDFVRTACADCGIENVTAVWGRAEELTAQRESFDYAVCRAVADLAVLAELCLPLVKVGGMFLAMKSVDCQEELQCANGAVRMLGGRVQDVVNYTIPGTDVTHAVIRIRKETATQPQYPRRYATIVKRPLK